jgi:hypothetical protein
MGGSFPKALNHDYRATTVNSCPFKGKGSIVALTNTLTPENAGTLGNSKRKPRKASWT